MLLSFISFFFFFFNDTATTEIYTLSLHDALPICGLVEMIFLAVYEANQDPSKTSRSNQSPPSIPVSRLIPDLLRRQDRKSTRLNSSHSQISYAVFCLKKKKNKHNTILHTSTS